MSEPRYWQHETSGVLGPAVMAYLGGGLLSREHVAVLRGYFRQWILVDAWDDPQLAELRLMVDTLCDRDSIARWLDLAVEVGIDPL